MTECQTLFDMAVTVTIEAVREELLANKLDEQQLERIKRALTRPGRDKSAIFQSLFERAEKSCRVSLSDPIRANILGRLLIAPVEPILYRNGGFVLDDQIGSFLSFVQFVVGEDRYEETDQLAASLFSNLVVEKGKDFSWELFYRCEETNQIMTPIYSKIFSFFSHFDMRIGVFCDFMRRNTVSHEVCYSFSEKNSVHFLRYFLSPYIRPDFLLRSEAEARLDVESEMNLQKLSHNLRLICNEGRFSSTS